MKVLILGGTRFLGLRVCRLLEASGVEVTVLHRGVTGAPGPGTRSITGDRSQPDGLAGLGDARFEAVLDLSGYFSDWTRAASETLTGRVAHYVFVSSGAVYRPSPELPWPESTLLGPNPIWGRYGEEKVASEKLLWEAQAQGRYAVTCFRFPFILGPGNFADRESFVFSRLEAGRPILLPDEGKALNQFVYVDDAARALVAALECPDLAAGQAYNCSYGRAITNRGWVELCADILGTEAKVVSIDEKALGVDMVTVDLNNLVFPYPSEHYVLDGTKLTRELGTKTTTGNRRMLEEYANWWESAADHSPRRYEREDKALTALGLAEDQGG
ncbi:MAG: NAD-dependent epimerase/dehydratase family protein [Acidimicrobiales bacterium]|jgi:nucleoside-diphosphate-sugar epimerase